jgi:hypothetical protein
MWRCEEDVGEAESLRAQSGPSLELYFALGGIAKQAKHTLSAKPFGPSRRLRFRQMEVEE